MIIAVIRAIGVVVSTSPTLCSHIDTSEPLTSYLTNYNSDLTLTSKLREENVSL